MRSARANVADVMDVIERRTISYAREELNLLVRKVDRRLSDIDHLQLRDVTALVAVGPRVDLYIAYSFGNELMLEIARRYTVGLTIPAHEVELYMHGTASELVNIIVGNCTADLAERGRVLYLSPPVLLIGGRQIQPHSDATLAVLTLSFDEGEIDVAFLGPQHLFDENLTYCGTSS